MAFGVVYLIFNKVKGKMYVGQTVRTIEERFKEHAKRKTTLIGKAIRKYGAENFSIEVLKRCYSKAELDAWEIFFIAALKTRFPIGYNMTDGGEGSLGVERTAETRAKISAANTGKKHPNSPEHNAKIAAANTGRKASDKTRAILSAMRKGKPLAASTCANMSEAQRGEKNHNYGKPLPSETCAKIAVANRGNSPFKNLIVELDAHNLSYYKLAKLMDLSYPSISAKMREKLKFTERDKPKLEKIFGKPADYLLKRELYENPAKARREDSPYKNLLNELKARHMSYRDLAKLLGVSHSNIACKMRGERNFTVKDKAKLEEIFGKPIEYLLACGE